MRLVDIGMPPRPALMELGGSWSSLSLERIITGQLHSAFKLSHHQVLLAIERLNRARLGGIL